MTSTPLLSQAIKYLKGVGPRRAELLSKELHIESLGDLLYTFPFRYIDRSEVHEIQALQEGMPYVQIRGRFVSFSEEGEGRKKRISAVFTDGTGYVDVVWFAGLKYVKETLRYDETYLLLGTPKLFARRISFAHPELEKIAPDAPLQNLGLQPVYHTTERMKKMGFSSKSMSKLMQAVFSLIESTSLPETLPTWFVQKHQLMELTKALLTAHFPPSSAALPEALRRLKFEELFYLQLDILRYMKHRQLSVQGFRFSKVGDLFLRFFHERLPFELTGAQKRVIREIRNDAGSGRQMNRLLQGDVGSGKTMVALMACLLALDNGFQACIMAPTEILAEQHLATITAFLGDLPVRVALLTGIVKGKARQEILDGVADGSVQLLIGTHTLIEPTVRFFNLGLAVIDEQHRFGVKQRSQLWTKNTRPPHILVMTATPIPRTLAMTVYGDLDVSIIDELPPGRKPIKTVHYYQDNSSQLYDGLRYQLGLGRQAYVVYPLIKENAQMDLKALEQGFESLREVFSDMDIGVVHGQMRPIEKESEMARFVRGETKILVSTTVIEVGVNVPNASVMVIENAERFGLAQLHQLRGRVGRGAAQSYCILVTKRELSKDSRARIGIMVDTNDGFEIAEADLKLRGPGDLEGTAQSGLPFDLKIANIVRDGNLLQTAREAAEAIIDADPLFEQSQNALFRQRLDQLRREKINFSEIS